MKREIKFQFKGNTYDMFVEREGDTLTFENSGEKYSVILLDEPGVSIPRPRPVVPMPKPVEAETEAAAPPAGGSTEKAAMTGVIKEILVSEGKLVNSGDLLLIMEAMKMDIEVFAGSTGTIKEIFVSPGMNVSAGQPLVGIA